MIAVFDFDIRFFFRVFFVSLEVPLFSVVVGVGGFIRSLTLTDAGGTLGRSLGRASGSGGRVFVAFDDPLSGRICSRTLFRVGIDGKSSEGLLELI